MPPKPENLPNDEGALQSFRVVQLPPHQRKILVDVGAVEALLDVQEGQAHERVLEVDDEDCDVVTSSEILVQRRHIPSVIYATGKDLAFRNPRGVIDGVSAQVLDKTMFE